MLKQKITLRNLLREANWALLTNVVTFLEKIYRGEILLPLSPSESEL